MKGEGSSWENGFFLYFWNLIYGLYAGRKGNVFYSIYGNGRIYSNDTDRLSKFADGRVVLR